MNEIFLDIGFDSLSKYNENLCGDHIEYIKGEKDQIVVLADGLGSGVKASILATLTSKIVSTMIAQGMSLTDCIETIAKTLPICKTRDIAYSTFTVMHFIKNEEVEIIQYDNPSVILLRNNLNYEFYKTEIMIENKRIFHSRLKIQRGDCFVALSDGCVYAGVGKTLNFGWQRDNIVEFLLNQNDKSINAKTLVKLLLDKCNELYQSMPGDDSSCLVVRVIKREPLNLLLGPPKNRFDNNRMLSLFFAKEGKRIVCGGTTSQLVAKYLKEPIKTSLDYLDATVPGLAIIEGIDLVTEGVITINKVLIYVKDFLEENLMYQVWSNGKDGASQIARLLIEEATDISFYVGTAINPAHQNPDLPINFSIKMQLVEELSSCLKKIGKNIKVSYF